MGLTVAGWGTTITGAVLSARGKKRMFYPERYADGPRLTVGPTLMSGSHRERIPGLVFDGRF